MNAVPESGHGQGCEVSKLRSDKVKIIIKCDRISRSISMFVNCGEQKETQLPDSSASPKEYILGAQILHS